MLYENELNNLSKEKLVELCNELLSELWSNGTHSNYYILKMIKDMEE